MNEKIWTDIVCALIFLVPILIINIFAILAMKSEERREQRKFELNMNHHNNENK